MAGQVDAELEESLEHNLLQLQSCEQRLERLLGDGSAAMEDDELAVALSALRDERLQLEAQGLLLQQKLRPARSSMHLIRRCCTECLWLAAGLVLLLLLLAGSVFYIMTCMQTGSCTSNLYKAVRWPCRAKHFLRAVPA